MVWIRLDGLTCTMPPPSQAGCQAVGWSANHTVSTAQAGRQVPSLQVGPAGRPAAAACGQAAKGAGAVRPAWTARGHHRHKPGGSMPSMLVRPAEVVPSPPLPMLLDGVPSVQDSAG